MAKDVALEKGLPGDLDAERFILGGILANDTIFPTIAGSLNPNDFSLEKHRRLFARMLELHERDERIDRVTVANELRLHRQLESCDGLTYLMALDEGMPTLANLDSYVRIVREKSRLRQLIFMWQHLINLALLDDGTAAHELAAKSSQQCLTIGTSDRENHLASVAKIITDAGGLDRFFGRDVKHCNGVQTGFLRLDQMTGGLQKGELIVIAARPSMGKTAIALNIAQHAAIGRQNLSVVIFSLEMSSDALVKRMLCSIARVDLARLRARCLNEPEMKRLNAAAEQFATARVFIDDSSMNTVMDIGAKLRRLRADGGVDLVLIDYLGLLASHRKNDNRVRELGEMTRYLKLMVAKEFDVPVVLLSQLSRACENRPGDHRPILSDLRESGDIEQDADVVAFVYREENYKPDKAELRGLAELHIAKQRNGPTGRVNLTFLKEYTRFENRVADAQA
jgi:replicative DNA helicase